MVEKISNKYRSARNEKAFNRMHESSTNRKFIFSVHISYVCVCACVRARRHLLYNIYFITKDCHLRSRIEQAYNLSHIFYLRTTFKIPNVYTSTIHRVRYRTHHLSEASIKKVHTIKNNDLNTRSYNILGRKITLRNLKIIQYDVRRLNFYL